MLIERINPSIDVGDFEELHGLHCAIHATDTPDEPPPTRQHLQAAWTYGGSGEPIESWVGRGNEHGTLAGAYRLAFPAADNTHLGELELRVHPDLRRRGHGRALLDHALGRLKAAGRVMVIGETRQIVPSGAAFATAVGAEHGLDETLRLLDLDTVSAESNAALLAQARQAAGGYRVIQVNDPVPDEHVDDILTLMERMSDAPVDNLDYRAEVWLAGRLRAGERMNRLCGKRRYMVAARHEESGRLVGLSTVFVADGRMGWADQGDTVVLPDHRGHRLGLLMKLSMLPWLAAHEPDVRKIITGNAASNAHMIHVNETMGYRVLDSESEWQLRVS